LDGKGKVQQLKWKIKKEKFCQKTDGNDNYTDFEKHMLVRAI
jgi:hypothetical protein